MKSLQIGVAFLLLFIGCRPENYKDLENGLYADLHTNKGHIIVKLYAEDTPLTVANFVGLAEGSHPKVTDSLKGKKYFNGNRFHRVIPNFMIQGGDLTETGLGTPGYQFADEFPKDTTGAFMYKHDAAGVVSMANPGYPNSNGSQFFMTHTATPWLDGKHTIFGKVIKGQKVVDKTAELDTILSVKILRFGKKAKNFNAINTFLSEEKKALKAIEQLKEEAKKAEEVRYQNFLIAKKACFTRMGADTITATSSGLKILKLKTTSGSKVELHQPVTINYTLFLGDGTKLESTLDKGNTPFVFQLNDDKKPLIAGFKEGLLLLREGEKARLFIPYYLAYGQTGGGPFPPKADIIFELEVLKIGK